MKKDLVWRLKEKLHMKKTEIYSNKLFVAAGAIFSCLLWGIATPVVKIGYGYMENQNIASVTLFAGVAFILSGILTVLYQSIVSKKFAYPSSKNAWVGVGKIAVLQTVLQYVLSFIGLLETTAVKATILKGSETFFAILVASLLFRQEKLTLKKMLICVIGFTGVVIANLDGLELSFNVGDGFILMSSFSYTISTAVVKQYSEYENPVVLSGYQMLTGGIVMLIAGAVMGGSVGMGAMPVLMVLGVIYAASYAVWNFLLKHNNVSSVTVYSVMTPIFGVICSSIILSEQSSVPVVNIIVALVFICTGIVIWNKAVKEC